MISFEGLEESRKISSEKLMHILLDKIITCIKLP